MSRTNGIKLLYLLFFLTIALRESEEKTPRTIRLVGRSADVDSFASQLSSFFGFGDTGGEKISSEELLLKISNVIKASETSILSALLQTSKLERIYDAVIAIHSSMKDLRLVVRTQGTELFAAYRSEFVTNYRETEVIKHIRFLPELLTYTIPGLDVPLIHQVREKTKCDRTSFGDFRNFYVNLLSNGIALQSTFEEFTKRVTLETVLESEWDDSLRSVQATFNTLERDCYDMLYERAMRGCTSGAGRSGYGLSWRVLVIGLVTGIMATTTGTSLF